MPHEQAYHIAAPKPQGVLSDNERSMVEVQEEAFALAYSSRCS